MEGVGWNGYAVQSNQTNLGCLSNNLHILIPYARGSLESDSIGVETDTLDALVP